MLIPNLKSDHCTLEFEKRDLRPDFLGIQFFLLKLDCIDVIYHNRLG